MLKEAVPLSKQPNKGQLIINCAWAICWLLQSDVRRQSTQFWPARPDLGLPLGVLPVIAVFFLFNC